MSKTSLEGVTPDLVISDLQLSHEESGDDAIDRVRRYVGDAIPALIVTGKAEFNDHSRFSEKDIQVLFKPVAPARLRAFIYNRCVRPQAALLSQ